VLAPSVFVWPHVNANCDEPHPLAIVYPAPFVARAALPRLPDRELLALLKALGDDTRLRALRLIAERPLLGRGHPRHAPGGLLRPLQSPAGAGRAALDRVVGLPGERRELKRALLLLCVPVLVAACGGGGSTSASTTTSDAGNPASAVEAPPGGRVRTLYDAGGWAVVQAAARGRARAWVVQRVGDRWRVDRSQRVKVRILGPDPGTKAAPVPQIAAELVAPAPLAESGLWVDGEPLEVKGGGTPRRGTIYGAPASPLAAGTHVAVAYGRTADTGTAVAWTFRV
jgi:DNA-binding transcriptional ArsR family regulator